MTAQYPGPHISQENKGNAEERRLSLPHKCEIK